jgi:lipopolysaccharide export system permease protein
MLTLDWYLARVILKNIFVVLLVVFVIQFFTMFVKEVTQIDLDYQLGGVVIYSILYLPIQAYEMLPVILLIGGMIGLGSLANGSELTVIRATGKSIRSITVSVTKIGIPLVLAMFLIGEFVALPLITYAEEYKAISLGEKISISKSDNSWIKDGDMFINIKGLQAGDEQQFSYFRVDSLNQLREILTAERSDPTDEGWHLHNVVIVKIGNIMVETENYDEYELKTGFNKEGIGKLTLNPRDINMLELYGYADYLVENNMASEAYFFSFWQRLLQPLSALGMLLLALPFVFGSLREKSISNRVMTGVFLGIGFFILSQTVNHLGIIIEIPAIFGASLPPLVIIGVWLYLLRRADQLH